MLSISRVGLALATAAVVLLGATALRFERVLGDAGQPSLTFGVDVPYEARDTMRLEDVEATWRRRLRELHLKIGLGERTREDSIGVRIEVIGAGPADARRVQHALTSAAHVEIRPVVAGTDTAVAWLMAYDRGVVQLDGGASVEPDAWNHDRTGREYTDAYVRGPDRASVERAIAVLQQRTPLPPDVDVLIEHVVPMSDEADHKPYFRTYLVGREVIIDNDDFETADITYDPNTLLPEVAVSLSRAGGVRFGDYTSAHTGEKLAVVLDGGVVSAPVVMSAITQGRISITMGAGPPEEQLAAAESLVGALGGSGRLPRGIEARLVGTHAGSTGVVWTARVLLALLAGVLVWLLPVALARGGRRWFAVAPSVTPSPGAPRWDAMLIPVGVTVALPVLLWFAGHEPWLPGVNSTEVWNIVSKGGDVSSFGIFALGIAPVLSAFVLVELVVAGLGLLVPSFRTRRLGTPADRRHIELAVWLLVPVLAGLQGFFVAQYLDSMNSSGAAIFAFDRGIVPLITLTLMTGVMVHVVVAELISRHGVCNGYLLLGAVGVLPLVDALLDPTPSALPQPPDFPSTTLRLAVLAAVAVATFAVVRVRSVLADGRAGPRLPYTGTVPTEVIRTGFALLSLAALWSPWVAERIYDLQSQSSTLIEAAAVVPLSALVLWTTRAPWTRAGVIATFVFLGLLAFLPYATDEHYRMVLPLTQGVTLGIAVAELIAGVHARVALERPATVLVVHDVFRADAAADRLTAAGIPHAVLGIRARAALRLLGAYIPVEIRVPADRVDDARALLADA